MFPDILMMVMVVDLGFAWSKSLDQAIVISRPENRVELDDLLLEYNHQLPDEPEKTITTDIALHYVNWKNRLLTVFFTLKQSWSDERLKFQGNAPVAVPQEVKLWQPHTEVLNALRTENSPNSASGLLLFPNGQLSASRRISVTVPCHTDWEELSLKNGQVNCTLTIGNLVNSGAKLIHYLWNAVELAPFSRSASIIAKSILNSTLEEKSSDGILFSRLQLDISVQTVYSGEVLRYLVHNFEL